MPILDQYSSTGLNCFSLFFRKKKMSAYPLNNAIARIQSSVLLFGVSDAVLKNALCCATHVQTIPTGYVPGTATGTWVTGSQHQRAVDLVSPVEKKRRSYCAAFTVSYPPTRQCRCSRGGRAKPPRIAKGCSPSPPQPARRST
jgi:hypothetical protein